MTTKQLWITMLASGLGGAIIGIIIEEYHISHWWILGLASAWGLSVAYVVPRLIGDEE